MSTFSPLPHTQILLSHQTEVCVKHFPVPSKRDDQFLSDFGSARNKPNRARIRSHTKRSKKKSNIQRRQIEGRAARGDAGQKEGRRGCWAEEVENRNGCYSFSI
ncbi:hypothetical protein CIPAW_01G088800 [Carya illinoinensis]|uniref:Uncharacterized protein n=1 Tax=Carya illinoinensis TaxID=32201 RepID=A0A8T1RLS5_CARIL|nr:hypothetical protein CIPAW_01G088800 [Carya illinoinensis]